MRLGLTALVLGLPLVAAAADTWKQPPPQVLEVLHAAEIPFANVSPSEDEMLLSVPRRYPPLSDLAKPMLRLAGLRIDPRSGGLHAEQTFGDLQLMRLSDGRVRRLDLPKDARTTRFRWSADGRRFAFARQADEALELWVGDTATAGVRRVEGVRLNPLLGSEMEWLPDQRTLLVKRIPPDRGPSPPAPAAPLGPKVQESVKGTASSTYEARDVLTSPQDEALFEHHALSQLTVVDAETGALTDLGAPGLIADVEASPDGRHVLVQRLHPPWSYLVGWGRFPQDVEVWDRDGKLEHVVAKLPLADRVPVQGVRLGPRSVGWRQTAPATLTWLEALDGGNPATKAQHRDKLVAHAAPFTGEPAPIHVASHRIVSTWWGERGLAIVGEYERERRWEHAWAVDADGDRPARELWSLSTNDVYADPGTPLLRTRPDGTRVLLQDGDAIFLTGAGSSPTGDRPFLDRRTLATGATERLWRSPTDGLEAFIDVLDPRARTFLTRAESPTQPPNYVVRRLERKVKAPAEGEAAWTSSTRALTSFPDPAPLLRGITKRIVTYEREDGVPLSFTLYLPPGHREGQRLPTVVWAYPYVGSPGTELEFAL